ncbi:MAG: long-chain fatty acid--CoA ligase [Ruminococcaceae bacterium]|nr:long-chain fatty acid--CoA ligase [Oscillospiraceae bacterium]
MSEQPWFKYYGDIPHSLEYPDKTISQLILETAEKYPENIAYDFMGKKTKFKEFANKIDITAKALLSAGIQKGDRVTIAMPNSPQAVNMFYALNRIGAIGNMIHPLSAEREIAFYLNASKSVAILTLDQFYQKINDIIPDVKQPIKIIVARIQDEFPFSLQVGYSFTNGRKFRGIKTSENILRWKDFIKSGKNYKEELPKDDSKADDVAAILYSGGTTGTTKGILLSNMNINALGLQTAAASGYTNLSEMKMLSVMPIFHGFGLGVGIHTALISGAQCILVPRFSIKTYAKLLKKKKPNFIPGVPTLFEALLRCKELDGVDLSFLKGVFCGGDSLSVELKKTVDKFLKEHNATVQIREGYGATECVTASCLTPKDFNREGSIGVPFLDTFYTIVEQGTENPVTVGADGEICLRGPSVMLGYMDNPKETAQTLRMHADGHIWLHTGDLGFMDEDGFVYFKQRIKRMIVTSGYNVYPSQLENIIDGHEKVSISCVIGVKDDYKMQKIKAFVVPAQGIEPGEGLKKELFDYCRKHIAKYSMPYDIEFRQELPKTLVGKVAYRILEEEEEKRAKTLKIHV